MLDYVMNIYKERSRTYPGEGMRDGVILNGSESGPSLAAMIRRLLIPFFCI